jgi:hypothetical protein
MTSKAYKPAPLTAAQRAEAFALYRARHDIYEVATVLESMQIALTTIAEVPDDAPFSPYVVKARVTMARLVLSTAYDSLERLIDTIDNTK